MDKSGNLWVGMQNRIALIDIKSPLRLINQNIGLQGGGYEGFETQEGTYYTTSNGIYFLPVDASTSSFLHGTEGLAYGMQLINKKIMQGTTPVYSFWKTEKQQESPPVTDYVK